MNIKAHSKILWVATYKACDKRKYAFIIMIAYISTSHIVLGGN